MSDTFDFFENLHHVEEHVRPTWGARLRAASLMPVVSALIGVLVAALFVPGVLAATATAKVGLDVWENMPHELPIQPTPQRSVMVDRHGRPFATFYSENRVNLRSEDIAQVMKDAQVSIEDTRFYDRTATLDWKALARAVAGNVVTAGGYGGGSTITQQYVKNVLMNNAQSKDEYNLAIERSIPRKIREMRLAVSVEQQMSREDILTGYLNIANYGDGAFGVAAAAQHYFGVPASKLTLTQAATLAGIVQAPANNPVSAPNHTINRRNVVLRKMLDAGRITQDEYDTATAAPLGLNITKPDNGCIKSDYPYYCEQVLKTVRNDPAFGNTPEVREQVLYRGGLTIKTALDPEAMRIANKAASKALGNDNQFAAGVAIVQPGTGHVLGFGQNRTFDQTQLAYATTGFQNGSTFKPITLAAALEDGWDIADTLSAPGSITRGGKSFSNQSRSGIGTMNAADALAVSSNTFFVRMSTDVTSVRNVQQMARRLGIAIPENVTGTEAATTLGVYDASPVATANAYATFAAHGVYCKPTYVTEATGPMGTYTVDSQCRQELEPGVADTVAHALTTVVDGPNAARTGRKMSIGRPTMGKTGTTTGNSSVWFAGGTPQYATAVWIGDPRGGFKHPVNRLKVYGRWLGGVHGSTAAGPIWRDVMTQLHKDKPVQQFGTPSTVKQQVVIPDVRGMDPVAAAGVLRDAGYSVTVKATTEGDGPTDTVWATTPAQGSALNRRGGSVELILTNGSTTTIVLS